MLTMMMVLRTVATNAMTKGALLMLCRDEYQCGDH
jgi:hypothetical protein